MDRQLLFLTGIGRSGTTLVQQMLHSHPQINFQPETHFFKHYILPVLMGRKWSVENYRVKLEEDKYISRLPSDLKRILRESDVCVDALKSAFIRVLNNAPSHFGADKDTEYVRYFPHLKKVFPHAYLLNVVRDPRDVVLSRTKTPWGEKRSAVFHAAEYVHYFRRNKTEGPQFYKDHYREIRYEDLLNDYEKVLNDVCHWIGLDFSPQMLDYYKNEQLVADDEKDWKGNVHKSVLSNNIGKWKNELDSSVVGLLENQLGKEMEDYGYSLSKKSSNFRSNAMFYSYLAAFQYKTRKERLNG